MVLAILVFVLAAAAVLGGYAAITYVPGMLAQRRLNERIQGVSGPYEAPADASTVVKRAADGPLPAVDRLVSKTSAGLSLTRLIEQSGVNTTPSAIVLMTLGLGAGAGLLAAMFAPKWFFIPVAALVAACGPTAFLLNRRSSRLKKFEEQFPEALDLMSRALKAGHAFQSAMGMAADELKAPVGPEFKKTFDQQNYGLPLRDALIQMSERVAILDVRFFVTAVLIQRETGGNLSEILENLAHVVRERFKIRRQVRVHTAHGRFTAFVLLALPAALAITLSMLNPDHMAVLFHERMGQTMLIAAMILQTIGFFWIRKVIKIEV